MRGKLPGFHTVNPGQPLDTRRIRADNGPMKGKSRRERVATMSLAERDDLLPLARKVRADARRDALQVVVDAALSLHTERKHEGQGHGARLRMREDELCAAIKQAAEDIKEGPITEDDLMISLAIRDTQ